ncbi:protein yellow-like [Adelges cooleyi]|uniref:protein yellow-like n=1 Tax=Adelges cooleyi TaxID=133065 RepID=UPI0021801A13|nr:protein yellow-like [Adelges cooleyi]
MPPVSSWLLSLVTTMTLVTAADAYKNRTMHKWVINSANLAWQSAVEAEAALESGRFRRENIMISRFQMMDSGDAVTTFLVMPNLAMGVPFTLGKVELAHGVNNLFPQIAPFPHWDAYNEDWTKSLIVNVVDVYVDVKGVLWALDVGDVETKTFVKHVSPPKILAMDPQTSQIKRVASMASVMHASSFYQYIVALYTDSDDLMVFVSDPGTNHVVVYVYDCDRFFEIILSPDIYMPGKRDILYMAPLMLRRGTRLLLTYHDGWNMYKVQADIMDKTSDTAMLSVIGEKPCNMVLLGTDRGSVLFFRMENTNDVWSWDGNTPLDSDNFNLVHLGTTCRVPVVVCSSRGLMWVMETNFVDYFEGTNDRMGANAKLQLLQKPTPPLRVQPRGKRDSCRRS